MIEKVEFTQFQVLKNATLKLSPLTLIIGPNGSGKTTALKGIKAFSEIETSNSGYESKIPADFPNNPEYEATRVRSIGWQKKDEVTSLKISLKNRSFTKDTTITWTKSGQVFSSDFGYSISHFPIYAFDHNAIASFCPVKSGILLEESGANLTAVLDQLRDVSPERFNEINAQLSLWIPEFDRILFSTPTEGKKTFSLRGKYGVIPASDLSQGTLFALAMLTLAWLPEPPEVIAIEEPDRGIHPRLLRQVVDALRRLAYPQEMGEPNRKPVQVIATTHSPLMLDFFRDHPEEIVIAEKKGDEATFSRLDEREDLKDILHDTNLGDLWYSGVLGGVPAGT